MKKLKQMSVQCAKKVVSDRPGASGFCYRASEFCFYLPDGQVMFFKEFKKRRTVKSILLVKKFLGLVEMTSGLVNTIFSLPEWQVVKMIFFAPCCTLIGISKRVCVCVWKRRGRAENILLFYS